MNTIFLATVIGWYLVIFSLFVFFKHEYMKSVVKDIMTNRGQFFIVAVMTLILGLLMVTSHNVWVMGWPVIITIFSWLVLIGGLIRLFCPDTVHKVWKSMFDDRIVTNVIAVVILIIGLYLLLHVYHVQVLIR